MARSNLLSKLVAVAVVCLVAHGFLASAGAFIQPQPSSSPAKTSPQAAIGAALAAAGMALPAQASYNWNGPLTGSEICNTKPIVWLIYPLCDPVFLVSPIYLFPITLIVFGSLITVLNLLIPATQPDEDLR
mmetsp:Transcript_11567/g.29924  ORF Transcript_11567/g.29924 Transcript_11567/m.29924 type:complete len:131 (+) Transcript_11567:91-483(+)|eukprot:CAMPEP_0183430128 /NCGR_PEP_ID=MMETSP0370-20130417/49593_1 /TAXON_ID=268820 /ORGANISM="Peridinium aciculiferum, Strain PAER-2" /LENGTH=130 /DNA_ID=CAMNT_0025615363 /DNA_START=80 /DNA_END=472 /DNA_ORIENTATION=-